MSIPTFRLQEVSTTTSIDEIIELVERDGGVVIKRFVAPDDIQRFNEEIQLEMNKLPAGKTADLLDLGDGEALHGSNTKRLPNCIQCSKIFREDIMDHDLMHDLCEKIFCQRDRDGYWVNTAMVMEIGPRNESQPLHRDQELYTFWNSMGPRAPEAIVNFMLACSPFREENGATRIVPGSHTWENMEDFIGHGDDADKQVETVPVEMDVGDCLLFSGKLLHGGGANVTHDQYRRGMSISIVRYGLMGEEANPIMIPREIADTMSYRVQAMFGFRTKWPVKGGPVGPYWSHQYNELGRTIGLKDKPIPISSD